jgi:hypothetical protein
MTNGTDECMTDKRYLIISFYFVGPLSLVYCHYNFLNKDSCYHKCQEADMYLPILHSIIWVSYNNMGAEQMVPSLWVTKKR